MFKFPEGNLMIINDFGICNHIFIFLIFSGSEVHLQCDVAQCQGTCAEESCPGDIISASAIKGGRPGNKEDGSNLAATTVFVLDPADAPCKLLF